MDARYFREWARLIEGKPNHLFEDVMIAAAARVPSPQVGNPKRTPL